MKFKLISSPVSPISHATQHDNVNSPQISKLSDPPISNSNTIHVLSCPQSLLHNTKFVPSPQIQVMITPTSTPQHYIISKKPSVHNDAGDYDDDVDVDVDVVKTTTTAATVPSLEKEVKILKTNLTIHSLTASSFHSPSSKPASHLELCRTATDEESVFISVCHLGSERNELSACDFIATICCKKKVLAAATPPSATTTNSKVKKIDKRRYCSAYNFYVAEIYDVVKAANPQLGFAGRGKKLGEGWKNLEVADRSRFEEMAKNNIYVAGDGDDDYDDDDEEEEEEEEEEEDADLEQRSQRRVPQKKVKKKVRHAVKKTAKKRKRALVISKFLVERILSRRGQGENLEFLVKWYGFGNEMCTWERASSFTSATISRLVPG